MTQEHGDSQLKMMKKFANFWSNVTRVDVTKMDMSKLSTLATLDAIVDGMRRVEPDKYREVNDGA